MESHALHRVLTRFAVRTLGGVAGVLACAAALAAQDAEILFGTWELNTRASESNPSQYKRTTCWIEPHGDGVRVRYELVGERGGVVRMEWTGRFDGRDYAVQGVDYVLTNAYRWVDEQTYEVVIKVDGAPAARARTTVSPDGDTLTTFTRERLADGREVASTVVYERR